MAVALAAASLLAACGADDQDELQQWMAERRSQVRTRVAPLTAPKQFTPQAYNQEGAADPFSLQRLASVLRQGSGQGVVNTGLLAPELARRREPLEAYPLDAMSMVGSLRRDGKPVALVRVDNLLYQVRLGEHLGQNYGKVTKIDEAEVILREIVQDGSGDWIERAASLQLQEKVK
ncbi:MAG TPA: pilus assembly protein PilP [Pseudorhodoferax sp.]|jgi:type IV pilus assembly protein PilP|nr:pilus assembly protein PilP [Pseudorhodoferax sp.]